MACNARFKQAGGLAERGESMNKDKPDHCFPTDPYRETHNKRTGFICPENRKCMCFQCDSKGCEHWMAEIPNIPTYHMNSELVKTYGDMKTMANDLISRQAAVDAILDLHDCPNGYSDTYDKACIIGVLEELPSAVVPIKDKCLTCIYCENCTDEQTFEEFMFGQDMGNPEDGSL